MLAAILVLLIVRDSPAGVPRRQVEPTLAQVGADLASAWRHPGTRLDCGPTTTRSPARFALLWGFPFLVSGEQLSRKTASTRDTVRTRRHGLAPFIGVMVERHPLRRSWLVLGVVGANACVDRRARMAGHRTLWLLALLVLSSPSAGLAR